MRGALGLAASVALAVASAAAAQPQWRPLLPGDGLEGLRIVGGKATYERDGDVVTGTTVPSSPNTFLCTEREYGDFELELELQVDPRINSGVQIRSHVRPEKKRVYGLQVEIDPSDRAWSGGIYDEARRGWLDDLDGQDEARQAFDVEGWNHYRVLCIGDHIRTWVNGVPAADLVDSEDLTGFIALQVHGVGKDADKVGRHVRWRGLRIKDLGHHQWQPVLDETLAGWQLRGGGTWRFEDGILIGEQEASDPSHGILQSEAMYGDFTARLQFRCLSGNSGFYFRCEPVEASVMVHGLQAEIDADPAKHTGGLYETGGRQWLQRPPAESGFRAGEWNTMTVSARGGRVTVHLNGVRTAELRGDAGRSRGHLGLQLHGGQDVRLEVRGVEVLRRVELASGR